MQGNGMRLRVLVILTLLVTSLILLSAAQTPDYSGKAKIVMKLTQMPSMPKNEATFGEEANTFGTPAIAVPDVPQGSMLQGEVLYSSDPAVKTGQTYTLYINYNPQNEPYGFQSGLVDQLKSGAVLGINDYTVQGNQITVNVGTSANWKSKVFIVDMQYTDPGESKNPFMINLNGFRQFNALPSFNYSTEFKPMFNASSDVWNWNTNPLSNAHSFFGGQGSTGLFSMFSRLFG